MTTTQEFDPIGRLEHQKAQLREALAASQRREHAMAAALLVIQGEHCQSFTSGLGSCYRNGRTDDATYGADRTCHSCLAHRVLSPTDPPAGGMK